MHFEGIIIKIILGRIFYNKLSEYIKKIKYKVAFTKTLLRKKNSQIIFSKHSHFIIYEKFPRNFNIKWVITHFNDMVE